MQQLVRTRRAARRRVVLLVVAGVAVVLLVSVAVVGVRRAVQHEFACSGPPSAQERVRQEAFVRVHVGDAHGFGWETADCDDDGVSTLTYETSLDPAAALAAFRADPVCVAASPRQEPGGLVCATDPGRVVVGVERDDRGRTTGYLVWTDLDLDR
ncbi:hypothetical protein ACFFOM_02785 [Microlunatus capsulatus]|uniref:Serine/threonine protein kinase n=1 Tax=Microlunatus capsulatus TaxID=99117 RepID=A0ABS4Z521_9ACTN|nr:hypothetical protein [Microlunatus capsulatus]MBP2415348.1 hypothetical protein [Microlunatus capsulatus]